MKIKIIYLEIFIIYIEYLKFILKFKKIPI